MATKGLPVSSSLARAQGHSCMHAGCTMLPNHQSNWPPPRLRPSAPHLANDGVPRGSQAVTQMHTHLSQAHTFMPACEVHHAANPSIKLVRAPPPQPPSPPRTQEGFPPPTFNKSTSEDTADRGSRWEPLARVRPWAGPSTIPWSGTGEGDREDPAADRASMRRNLRWGDTHAQDHTTSYAERG